MKPTGFVAIPFLLGSVAALAGYTPARGVVRTPGRLVATDTILPNSLLRLALARRGAASHGASRPVLTWKARAVVHLPDRDIILAGDWQVHAPDSAIAATYDSARGPTTTRRMILMGRRGWLQSGAGIAPMPPGTLAEERHQFYLYSLLQLTPLLRGGVKLRAVPRDSTGNAGFRVDQPGRLPVMMYFDTSGRVAHLLTSFATSAHTPGDSQDIVLTGEVETDGATWFRHMTILRAGKPYFEMEISSLQALPNLTDTLFRRLTRSRP